MKKAKNTGCKMLALLLLTAMALPLAAVAAEAVGSGFAVVAQDVAVIKSGLIGQKMVFSDTDFKQALILSDFEKITLTQIPPSTEGTLLLAGRRIGVGQSIRRKNLAALVFVPAGSAVRESHFRFTVPGYAGGCDIDCTMRFLDRVNYAPEATGIHTATAATQAGIPLSGTLGASDPEGDEITLIPVRYPAHGTLTVTGTEYRYCPEKSYTGRDCFQYVARDAYGNYSAVCTVPLTVTRRECDTEYADMANDPDYGAAVAMTARGIVNGTLLGDSLYFRPDEVVSRAAFVSMALKSVGIRADSTSAVTYFDDDALIPEAYRGYVATAQKCGLIIGSFTGGALLFRPNDAVTAKEAAIFLARLYNADGDTAVGAGTDAVASAMRDAIGTAVSLGIFDKGFSPDEKLTRGTACRYLYRLVSLSEPQK